MGGVSTAAIIDDERCYRAVASRDRRFDGAFYTAVRTTRIYCRPSCPAVTPRRRNVEFYRSAAAAQLAGYRACRRCLPDATPGSAEWDVRADVAGRAMRLINDGVVEREGVQGLAIRLGYTSRHLSRVLLEQMGAGPLALARARRAQTARVLIDTTSMSMAEVAFAAGFASVRQFNQTVGEVYACTPSALRAAARPRSGDIGADGGAPTDGPPAADLTIRLAVRQPFDAGALLRFLAARAVCGVESVEPGCYRRTLRLPHGPASVALTLSDGGVLCGLRGCDPRDVMAAVERCRRLLDLDADPEAVVAGLSSDEMLAPIVGRTPGLRVPGHVDGTEVAVRAVLGQQISVARARTLAARLVQRSGDRADGAGSELTHLFPTAAAIAALDPETLPMPRARGRALTGLCAAIDAGDVVLDRSADRAQVRASLLAVPGIGPWTADYIAMRALGDPDVFLPTDVGVRHALRRAGRDHRRAAEVAEDWRPWRSYAVMHLWNTLTETPLTETPLTETG
ncbi:MAG TPA: AlkA N-terminal domain-containing protein [Nocardioidaceae bacterium]|nr:AlkA N-terminal domain-containing protein [Nocardioidaceae bacterium]